MARIQPTRGNPEVRQVFTTDNFAGGINLAFSDDNTADSELRHVLNYTLDERGSLSSRKGFGEYPVFRSLFGDDNTDNLFSFSQIGLVHEVPVILLSKIYVNDNSFFQNAINSNTLLDFQRYQTPGSKLKMFILWYKINATEAAYWTPVYDYYFTTIQLLTTANSATVTTTKILSSEVTSQYPHTSSLNISNFEYADKLYFILEEKLYNFDFATGTVTAPTVYKPNAIEVRKVGFNVLADTPLAWLDNQGITTKSIQGMYLTLASTDTNLDKKVPLMGIPNSASFYLNIMYTGTITGFDIAFKDFDTSTTLAATKTLISNAGGIAQYKITFDITPFGEVEIKVNETGQTNYTYDYYNTANLPAELKPVNKLSLKGFKFTHIYSRLVYYSGNIMWFSDIGRFDYIPNYNYVVLPIDNEDEITRIMFFRNVYIIFTKKQIFKMTSAFGSSDFALSLVNDTIGCIAGSTAVMVETEIYFLSYRGLYSLKAEVYREGLENVRKLDTKVEKFIPISEKCYAVYIDNQYILYANGANSTGLRFDTYSLLHWGVISKNLGYDGIYASYEALVARLNAHMDGTNPFPIETNTPNGNIFMVAGTPDTKYYQFLDAPNNTYTLTEVVRNPIVININGVPYAMPDAIRYHTDLKAFSFDKCEVQPQYMFLYEGSQYCLFGSISGVKENFDFEASYGSFDRIVETTGLSMGYPLHQKKVKEITLKVSGGEVLNPIYVTGFADGLVMFDTRYFVVSIDEVTGEVVYLEENDPTFSVPPTGLLGYRELGTNVLGTKLYYLGKIKEKLVGKNISLKIYTNTATKVGIQSIGYTFKLGKIKQ